MRFLGKVCFLTASCVLAPSISSAMPGSAIDSPVYIIASAGLTKFQYMYSNDGQTAIGRMAIGKKFRDVHGATLGLEAGIQSGNTMRLGASEQQIDTLGGVAIDSTAKPMLDLLVTATNNVGVSNWTTELKAGIGFYRWQFNNRDTINSRSNFVAELQAGLGYAISKTTMLHVGYQGVFGNNPRLSVGLDGFGHVASLPTQHGVLFGVSTTV